MSSVWIGVPALELLHRHRSASTRIAITRVESTQATQATHHTAAARKAGMTEAQFAELMAVVGMANETNRLANGYQVEIDETFRTPAS